MSSSTGEKLSFQIMKVEEQPANGFVRFTLSNDFPVGKYQLRLIGETKDFRRITMAEFDCIVLFNPFQITDETYRVRTKESTSHVLTEP